MGPPPGARRLKGPHRAVGAAHAEQQHRLTRQERGERERSCLVLREHVQCDEVDGEKYDGQEGPHGVGPGQGTEAQGVADRPGRAAHRVWVGRVGLEHERHDRVEEQLERDEVDGQEQQRLAEQRDDERTEQQRRVERDEVGEGAREVVEDAAATPYCSDDGGEVVVEEDERGAALVERVLACVAAVRPSGSGWVRARTPSMAPLATTRATASPDRQTWLRYFSDGSNGQSRTSSWACNAATSTPRRPAGSTMATSSGSNGSRSQARTAASRSSTSAPVSGPPSVPVPSVVHSPATARRP